MTTDKSQNTNGLYVAGAIIALLFIFYVLRAVFIPLILSFFIAYMINPVVELLERKRIHRAVVTIAILTALIGASILLFSSLLSVVQREMDIVSEKLPVYISSFERIVLERMKDKLMFRNMPTTIEGIFENIGGYVKGLPPDVLSLLLNGISAVFKSTLSFIIGLLGFLIMPFYIFYILKDFRKIKTIIWFYIPSRKRQWFDIKWDEVDNILHTFFRGQLILSLMMIIMYSASLYLIGVELALLIGVIAGVAFIIPLMGLVVGSALGATMALLQYQDIGHPLAVIMTFVSLQIIEAYILTPRIIGKKVGLHPVTTIVSILVWGELLGLFGIIVAIPMTAVMKVFFNAALQDFRKSYLSF